MIDWGATIRGDHFGSVALFGTREELESTVGRSGASGLALATVFGDNATGGGSSLLLVCGDWFTLLAWDFGFAPRFRMGRSKVHVSPKSAQCWHLELSTSLRSHFTLRRWQASHARGFLLDLRALRCEADLSFIGHKTYSKMAHLVQQKWLERDVV